MPIRHLSSLLGAAALASWAIALQQAMPRLLAGPICSSSQDSWAFAGHCPACFVAAGLTVAFLGSLAMGLRRRRATALIARP
jgi:hypothetical protein